MACNAVCVCVCEFVPLWLSDIGLLRVMTTPVYPAGGLHHLSRELEETSGVHSSMVSMFIHCSLCSHNLLGVCVCLYTVVCK